MILGEMRQADPDAGAQKCRTGGRLHLAFTLAEMLVVIAIIGILAGLIFKVVPRVLDTRDYKRMQAFVNKVDLGIQDFYSTYNTYPQSNTNTYPLAFPGNVRPDTVTNNLLYELSGTVFDTSSNLAGVYRSPLDWFNPMDTNFVFQRFGYSALIHSTNGTVPANAPKSLMTDLKSAEYGPVPVIGATPLEPQTILLFKTGIRANPNTSILAPLRYDRLSTNRHNMKSYDLWVIWTNSSKPVIVGNF
jgi:prepilin-type N-terminal cleavage/methylation domain-containing protein